jgi:serralysin
MVSKVLNSANSWAGGDLNTVGDNFGADDDTIEIIVPPSAVLGIWTYGGDDLVFTTGTAGPLDLIAAYYLGTGNDTLNGSGGIENYYDEGGNDRINMGGGDDVVGAGIGDDKVRGGAGIDVVSFVSILQPDGNFVANSSPIKLDLALTTKQDLGIFGKDIYLGFENANGSNGSDWIYGTEGANSIAAMAGNDRLRGRNGNDTLIGGTGRDTIDGGRGADKLYANNEEKWSDAAPDVFKYNRISDSAGRVTDTIYGFTARGRGHDKIDLRAVAVENDEWHWVGHDAFSMPGGEIRYETVLGTALEGGGSIVYIDTDGDTAAEIVLRLVGVSGISEANILLDW